MPHILRHCTFEICTWGGREGGHMNFFLKHPFPPPPALSLCIKNLGQMRERESGSVKRG